MGSDDGAETNLQDVLSEKSRDHCLSANVHEHLNTHLDMLAETVRVMTGNDSAIDNTLSPSKQNDTPSTHNGETNLSCHRRGTEYSTSFRESIVRMHREEQKSIQSIATELQIPHGSVRAILGKTKRTGSAQSAPRSGRPRKTSDLVDRIIIQAVKRGHRSTAKQIQEDLKSIYQIQVSCETIRRRVRDCTKPTKTQNEATIENVTDDPLSISSSKENVVDESVVKPLKGKKRRRSEYPTMIRERCISLHKQGMGLRAIGEQLNMPHTTVRAIINKIQRTGSIEPGSRSGRPRKTNPMVDQVILQTVKMNSQCSALWIQHELKTAYGVDVSCETIRRRVKEHMRHKHLVTQGPEPISGLNSEMTVNPETVQLISSTDTEPSPNQVAESERLFFSQRTPLVMTGFMLSNDTAESESTNDLSYPSMDSGLSNQKSNNHYSMTGAVI